MAATVAFPLFQVFGNETYEFERWVTRLGLLFLVLGMFPCIKYFKLYLHSIGHNVPLRDASKQIITGFIVGLIILAVVICSIVALDIRVLSDDSHLTFKLLLKALLAGLVVALIEETLFRGFFFTLAKKWHNSALAVVISSFFYAALHFIKPIEHIDQSLLNFSSGFNVIINAFQGFTALQLDDFFALFAVGVLLALVRLRTQSLTYCIGLHASWVFLIKICKELTDNNTTSSWAFLTGNYDGIIGLLSLAWLSLLSIAYVIFIIKPQSKSR